MGTPAVEDTEVAQESRDTSFAPYVPHDLKYNTDFEDNLMQAVLNPDSQQDGIRVIADDSDEQPIDGASVRATNIDIHSLPAITEEELPLALNDPRRIYASPIPGVKLTHPGGYLEGGPGLDPEMDTFPDDFISNNSSISNAGELRSALSREIEVSVELLRERLEARQKAKEKNERIEKELKTLTDQHHMELKINRRMAEEQKAKREAKERRRREKECG